MTTFSFRRTRHGAGAAFTLIELLASMAVLVLLIVAVTQIVNGTTRVSTANRQHLDADNHARLVFDRMALDFARMLKRWDVDYVFKDSAISSQAGDDKFFFYAEAPAFFYTASGTAVPASAQSPLSLVGYRINSSAQAHPFELARLGKGLGWDESNAAAQGATEPVSIAFLTPAAAPGTGTTTPDTATTLSGRWPRTLGNAQNNYEPSDSTSYHILSDQVCRMEICYLLKPRPAAGAAGAQPAVYSVNPYYGTDPAHNAVNGFQDVQAIVVALAVLDRASRQRVTDFSYMQTALPDITATNLGASPPTLMAKVWQDKIDSGTLATEAHIPRNVVGQVRVYQRHFYLDTH